jgi:hypothetical protein
MRGNSWGLNPHSDRTLRSEGRRKEREESEGEGKEKERGRRREGEGKREIVRERECLKERKCQICICRESVIVASEEG